MARIRVAAPTLAAAALLGLAVLLPVPASAQLNDGVAGNELLETWRRHTGNLLRFCYDENASTAAFDRAVGEEIGARMLVATEFVPIRAGYGIDGQYLLEDLFVALTNNCDAMLGLSVFSGYAVEFTVTQPYVHYDFVLGVVDPAYGRLLDIPAGARLGTQISTRGEVAFLGYNNVRSEGSRWLRLPYADPDLMLTRLLDGTIVGMVLFGPTFVQIAADRPEAAAVRLLTLDPVQGAFANVGAVLLAQSSFLRSEIDGAIASLVADGTIARRLVSSGLGDVPAGPGPR
ncbi:MAG: transporter substrate-binding domain-containing protein [Bauldia sp.]|nr:transporter substrate-binding domain-containing protein [Bauldia sp.]MCW5717578.1 transporter substrate-binding domain-containing protein [Bauldia sp.]